jgi:hypothetical protein
MYDWQNFDVVFHGKPDCSYDDKTVNAILKNRKELAGTLFFDRVWSNLGLKDGTFVKVSELLRELLESYSFRIYSLSTRLTYVSHQVIPSANKP